MRNITATLLAAGLAAVLAGLTAAADEPAPIVVRLGEAQDPAPVLLAAVADYKPILAHESHGASGVEEQDGSTAWSDLTAVFRPSRWRSPFRTGGPLSFINLECWITAPGRTAATFVGTAVVAGGIAALLSDRGGGHDGAETASGGSAAQTDSSSGGSSSGSGSGSGGGGGDDGGDDTGGWVEEEY